MDIFHNIWAIKGICNPNFSLEYSSMHLWSTNYKCQNVKHSTSEITDGQFQPTGPPYTSLSTNEASVVKYLAWGHKPEFETRNIMIAAQRSDSQSNALTRSAILAHVVKDNEEPGPLSKSFCTATRRAYWPIRWNCMSQNHAMLILLMDLISSYTLPRLARSSALSQRLVSFSMSLSLWQLDYLHLAINAM